LLTTTGAELVQPWLAGDAVKAVDPTRQQLQIPPIWHAWHASSDLRPSPWCPSSQLSVALLGATTSAAK
jgi:hypothetical protein